MATEHLTGFVMAVNSVILLLISAESSGVVIFAEPSSSSEMSCQVFHGAHNLLGNAQCPQHLTISFSVT